MISNFAKDLKIHNSLTGQKENFTPIEKNNVGMYVCGPTVYSNAHLGNCRTFISFDLIYRYLKHLGYKVRYVRNLTDVMPQKDGGFGYPYYYQGVFSVFGRYASAGFNYRF